jgi:hypothetical protein
MPTQKVKVVEAVSDLELAKEINLLLATEPGWEVVWKTVGVKPDALGGTKIFVFMEKKMQKIVT